MANVIGEHTIKANLLNNSEPIKSNLTTSRYATTEIAGIIRIATLDEAQQGTDNSTAITPYTLKNVELYSEGTGINITDKVISIDDSEIASQSEVDEINNTLATHGDIVTHDTDEFATAEQGQKADTAVQPSELNNYVPNTRTVNNKALSANITLNYSDVGALASTTTINDLTTTAQQNALNSGATTTNIGQIATNTSAISLINGKIPTQASTTNQLADKNFVNSSIATNTANFIGTFNSVADLEAYSGTVTNNDYAFVVSTDADGNTVYNRYKYNGDEGEWLFEYALNNSSFTANQWASINSGITSSDVTLIGTALQPNDNITQLTNNAGYITSSDLTVYLQNTATATDAITVLGTSNTSWINGINIGKDSFVNANNGIAIGVEASANTNAVAYGRDADAGIRGTAIGAYAKTSQDTGIAIGGWNGNTNNAVSSAKGAYQFGVGTNSAARTLNIGWYDDSVSPSTFRNYQLLNGNTGLIPDARMSETIARTTQLHSSKGYLESGTSYTDTTLYNDVYGYAHSTFDKSKFTKVGSPTITNDGIISNILHNTNYVRTNYSVPVSTANSWSMQVQNFEVNSLASAQRIFSFNSNNTFIYIDTDGKIKVYVSASSTGDVANNKYANYTVALNDIIDAELRFTGSAYEVWINGNKTYSVNSTTKISLDQVATVYSGGSGYAPCLGEHDLKQFSITVDGVPVFSGNKTGINTVKPDDYTVVGTPTISADGVLGSPTTASNYITTGFSYDISKDFEYRLSAYIAYQSGLGDQYLCGLRTNSSRGTLRFNGNRFYCVFAGSDGIINPTYSQAGWYDFIVSRKGTDFTLKYKLSTDTDYVSETVTLTGTYTSSNEELCIGYVGSNYMNYSQIDLNSFKFYDENGNLVYQPCLKIPYTQSKTGSKIVDVAYRDRVIDVYEQYGSALYYTIDETNKNVTLPMGSVYGDIQTASSSAISYPIGDNALSDKYLYSYIKRLYDNGVTILDNNYTLTGSPTISSKGIASGFSSSKYLQTVQFSLSNPFELIIRASVNSGLSGNSTIIGNGGFGINSIVMAVAVTNTYALRLSIHKDGTGSAAGTEYAVSADNIITPNVFYYFKVNYDGTKYVLTYSTDGIIYTSACTVNYSSLPYNNSNIKLTIGGSYTDQLWGAFSGSIDLNSFNIKLGGVNSVQGKYLTYKQVSTGSKILTDKDIVDTIFNASGSALYYVLDTTNQTVRLPKGDIFGFITQALGL